MHKVVKDSTHDETNITLNKVLIHLVWLQYKKKVQLLFSFNWHALQYVVLNFCYISLKIFKTRECILNITEIS